MTVLYNAEPNRGKKWQALFAEAAPDLPLHIWPEIDDPKDIRYLAAWDPSRELIGSLPNLEVVFSIGAGVDQFDLSRIPASIPLVRMIDPGLTHGMVEYCLWATLTLHRDIFDYLQQQRERRWHEISSVLSYRRRVGIMGLGELGRAVARQLQGLGFPVSGWSRSRHEIEGVTCYAGREELPDFLGQCDIVICLLPLTNETRGILCRETFELLPKGAGFINAARGGHVVEADLLVALDSGRISGAVIDVLNVEPAPADHPFWSHPRILLTPHVASQTHAESAGWALLDNIRRHQRGEEMHGLVRRELGY